MNDRKQRWVPGSGHNKDSCVYMCVRSPFCPANPTQTPALKASAAEPPLQTTTDTLSGNKYLRRREQRTEKESKEFQLNFPDANNFDHTTLCLIFKK